MKWIQALCMGALVATSLDLPVVAQQTPSVIDFDRARVLLQREQAGEKLSPDDQVYLDRAKAERANRQTQNPRPDPRGAAPPRAFTGLTPLTDLRGDTLYKGMDAG